MKMINYSAARILCTLMLLLSTVFAFAQDKGADINVDINKGGGGSTWYTSPIVWIVGGAIFILLLVALLRGNNSRN
jgi:hypothetical protein